MHAVSLCFIQVACFNHFIAVFTDTEKNSYTCIMLATDYSREARVLFLRVIGKVQDIYSYMFLIDVTTTVEKRVDYIMYTISNWQQLVLENATNSYFLLETLAWVFKATKI